MFYSEYYDDCEKFVCEFCQECYSTFEQAKNCERLCKGNENSLEL